MATLIPSLSTCVSRMTQGERRLAERLVLHPRRGLFALEVKVWRLDTIRQANKQTWDILPGGQPKTVANPAEQARHYAHQVVDALARDVQLVTELGRGRGGLCFPWS